MVKVAIRLIFLIIIIVLLFLGGCLVPFEARIIHAKIRQGMARQEIIHILDSTFGGRVSYLCSNREIFVLFRGPMFCNSSFDIKFNSFAKVEAVTPVRDYAD